VAERDGHAANADNIYLTAGASSGISLIMNVAICPGDGVL
jgi:aspartate/methionine/tyrosine aminotransferase